MFAQFIIDVRQQVLRAEWITISVRFDSPPNVYSVGPLPYPLSVHPVHNN